MDESSPLSTVILENIKPSEFNIGKQLTMHPICVTLIEICDMKSDSN